MEPIKDVTKHELFKKVHERAMKAIAEGRVTKLPSRSEEHNKALERRAERIERIKKFKGIHVPTNTADNISKPQVSFEGRRDALVKLKERAMKKRGMK